MELRSLWQKMEIGYGNAALMWRRSGHLTLGPYDKDSVLDQSTK